MSDPVYIYVHGFNSSPGSYKARALAAYLAEQGKSDHFHCPALSQWPQRAIEQLEALLDELASVPVVLIGSSLGGYYSHYLMQTITERAQPLSAVLVNPAVRPYALLERWLGENENIYTAERYRLTERHLEQLKALDRPAPKALDAYLLLVQTGDETLDYREAVEKYAGVAQFVQSGGSHGFDQFEQLIPAIQAFGQGRIELPEPTPLPFSAL